MSTVSVSPFLKKYSYWSKLATVRWQLLIAIVVLWFAGYWLRNEYGNEDSNLWLVMDLFIRLAQWTIIILFCVSILSALIVWLYFLNLLKRKGAALQVKLGDGQKAEAGWVPLSIGIQGNVFRPLLGTVQACVLFSDEQLTETLILDRNLKKPKSLWRNGIVGVGKTLLHDRGIYDVRTVLFSFCDMLGLVSLPVSVPFNRQLFTLPVNLVQREIKAQPNAAEEQKYRIDIPKRVEGEYVNYKEFETGDNIRRIVWKIYAKSGQLVVRIPETKDPYASHLFFFASFYHGFDKNDGAFERAMLNRYKDHVRNLLEAIQRNGYDVKIPADQEIPKIHGMEGKSDPYFQITACGWQSEEKPSLFVNTTKAAFVCLSSLTPADQLEQLVKKLQPAVPLVVVKLSNAIPSPFSLNLKHLFFKPERRPEDKLRQPWLFSGLRRALIKNEEQLQRIISSRENSWMIDSIEIHN